LYDRCGGRGSLPAPDDEPKERKQPAQRRHSQYTNHCQLPIAAPSPWRATIAARPSIHRRIVIARRNCASEIEFQFVIEKRLNKLRDENAKAARLASGMWDPAVGP